MGHYASVIALLFLGALTVLAATSCNRRDHNHLNVCPIDGSPPQWRGARNGNQCQYFHYSAVERQAHSWWAKCELAETEQPKQK